MFGHKAIFDRVGSPNIPLLDDRENLNLELVHRGSVMTTQDVFFFRGFQTRHRVCDSERQLNFEIILLNKTITELNVWMWVKMALSTICMKKLNK